MGIPFLLTVLEWLQERLIKIADTSKAKANNHLAQIRALEAERKEILQEAALASKLAGKIDNLLSE